MGLYSNNDWRDYLAHKEGSKYDWSTGKNSSDYNHDYYEKNKDIMSFDLVISFDEEDVDSLILSIKDDMQKLYPNTTILINFDQDFSLSE